MSNAVSVPFVSRQGAFVWGLATIVTSPTASEKEKCTVSAQAAEIVAATAAIDRHQRCIPETTPREGNRPALGTRAPRPNLVIFQAEWRMAGLHGCNDPQFLETRHILRLTHLNMLHSMTAVAFAVLFLDRFITTQCLSHGAIATAARHTESEVERRGVAAARLQPLLGRDPSRSFTDELIAERRAPASRYGRKATTDAADWPNAPPASDRASRVRRGHKRTP